MTQPEKDSTSIHSPAAVPDEWFSWKKKDLDAAESVARPSLSYWKDAWRRLRKNKLAMAGLVFLIILGIMAIIGPMISPYSVIDQNRPNQFRPPSMDHLFGTDSLGRDVFTRTWYGARISLFVGLMAALIDFLSELFMGAFPVIKVAARTVS